MKKLTNTRRPGACYPKREIELSLFNLKREVSPEKWNLPTLHVNDEQNTRQMHATTGGGNIRAASPTSSIETIASRRVCSPFQTAHANSPQKHAISSTNATRHRLRPPAVTCAPFLPLLVSQHCGIPCRVAKRLVAFHATVQLGTSNSQAPILLHEQFRVPTPKTGASGRSIDTGEHEKIGKTCRGQYCPPPPPPCTLPLFPTTSTTKHIQSNR